MIKRISLILLIIAAISFTSAQGDDALPQWVKTLIVKYKADVVGNPPRSIWQYEYNGQIVYYMPEQCCDLGSELYNDQGIKICSPDGGYAGRGDGKCMDFLRKEKMKNLYGTILVNTNRSIS